MPSRNLIFSLANILYYKAQLDLECAAVINAQWWMMVNDRGRDGGQVDIWRTSAHTDMAEDSSSIGVLQ